MYSLRETKYVGMYKKCTQRQLLGYYQAVDGSILPLYYTDIKSQIQNI